VKVDHYDGLNERTSEGVALPGQLAARYERTTGDRIDGVVAADPLAVAEILRVTGPIQAGGVWLDADNVAEETLVRAYVRYQTDNNARRQFLREVATASFEAFRRGLTTDPVNLIRHLGTAAEGWHVQVYVAEPAGQRAVSGLGLSGTAAAPASGTT
jgi:hypothetical protein